MMWKVGVKYSIRIISILLGLSLAVLLALSTQEHARGQATLRVSKDGGDYHSVQAAIDAISSGGTIWVAAGVYFENIRVQNKGIDIKGGYSSDFLHYDPEEYVTVIDGGQNDRVINLLFADNTEISGFEIRNGKTDGKGGGIFIDETQAEITGNKIHDNEAGSGGGIYSNDWSKLSKIHHNDIYNNTGVGIMLVTDSSEVQENTIRGNTGGGLGIYEGSPPHIPLIEKNIIRDNQGNGVFGGEAVVTARGNHITGNTGSGIYGFQHGATIAGNWIYSNNGWGIDIHEGNVVNNVVAGNKGGGVSLLWEGTILYSTICHNQSGGGIRIEPREGPFVITNCIVWGNTPADLAQVDATFSDIGSGNMNGEGNFSQDPLFEESSNFEYMLSYNSPCIDTGTEVASPTSDILGTLRPQDGDGDGLPVPDIGAYEMNPPPVEVVSPPEKPAGPTIVAIDKVVQFSTGGGVSNLGHSLQYQFSWGDGTYSGWSSGKSSTHSWSAAGEYTLMAQARCTVHQSVVSGMSAPLTLFVEGINKPSISSSATSAKTGEMATFYATGASSTLNHDLEYQFDWDDGTYSDWSILPSASNSWSASGNYQVRVCARCPDHEAYSEWSEAVLMSIHEPVRIALPNPPKGPVNGKRDIQYSFTTGGATTNQDLNVEYRFDWGDGSISDWLPLTTASHVWSGCSEYSIKAQARYTVYPEIFSEWSNPTFITIIEPEHVSVPNRPQGTNSGEEGGILTFFTGGASSNLGYSVEYRFDWGDGTFSEWSSSTQATHIWPEAGIYSIKVEARSTEEPVVVSTSSELFVTISELETISAPSPPEGPASGQKDVVLSFSTGGAVSNLGYSVEYRFDWGDGTFSDWSSSHSASHSWQESGMYNVRAQARSVVHSETYSEWSQAVTFKGLGEQFFKSLGMKIGIGIISSLCVGFILYLLRNSIKRLFLHYKV